MPTEFFISPQQTIDEQAISFEQMVKRYEQRRRRVAKRMYKRCPLFAVEFMQNEFPGYDQVLFMKDISRKTRKRKSQRKVKSPLKRQGRYPLFSKAMINYSLTKDQKHLEEAQRWRDRLYLPLEVVFMLNGEKKTYTYPSTTSLRIIQKLAAIKFLTWNELEVKKAKILEYAHIS